MHWQKVMMHLIKEDWMRSKQRYQEIIDGLKLKLSLDKNLKIRENFKKKAGSDYAATVGSILNGIIMANYLGYEFIDAAEVIFFDEDGNFMPETPMKSFPDWQKHQSSCSLDFTVQNLDGTVKTFSRGGSDITGSIVAKSCKGGCI